VTARDKPVIWLAGKAGNFLREDWTGQIRLKRFDKSDFWRTLALRVLRPAPFVRKMG
jgi:hypothetical protein